MFLNLLKKMLLMMRRKKKEFKGIMFHLHLRVMPAKNKLKMKNKMKMIKKIMRKMIILQLQNKEANNLKKMFLQVKIQKLKHPNKVVKIIEFQILKILLKC